MDLCFGLARNMTPDFAWNETGPAGIGVGCCGQKQVSLFFLSVCSTVVHDLDDYQHETARSNSILTSFL